MNPSQIEKTISSELPQITSHSSLTHGIQREHDFSAMKKNSKEKIMPKIALVPNAEEMEIVNATRRKYGLKAASEVLRMALTRFAEAEGLKAS